MKLLLAAQLLGICVLVLLIAVAVGWTLADLRWRRTKRKDGTMSLVDDRKDLNTAIRPDGQQETYLVLSEEERAKGFVRPVRRTYRHLKCGALTTMAQAIAETYSRNPAFYGGTFCSACGTHFPVGEAGEFVWEPDGSKVGT